MQAIWPRGGLRCCKFDIASIAGILDRDTVQIRVQDVLLTAASHCAFGNWAEVVINQISDLSRRRPLITPRAP